MATRPPGSRHHYSPNGEPWENKIPEYRFYEGRSIFVKRDEITKETEKALLIRFRWVPRSQVILIDTDDPDVVEVNMPKWLAAKKYGV